MSRHSQTLRVTLAATLCGVWVTTAAAQPAPAAAKPAAQKAATPAKASNSGELQRAYKREFAFLEAETNALRQRIARVGAEHPERAAAARGEVEGLQARATQLSLEADRLEEQLVDTERAADSTVEDDDALSSLLQQAGIALSAADRKLPEVAKDDPEAAEKQLDGAFSQAMEMLAEQSSVRVVDGKYFDRTGKQVKGPVVHVGSVARFGAAQGAAGALVPAGEGALKLWPNGDSSATALALANGETPSLLQVFVFDGVEKAVDVRKEKTLQEIMNAGGVIGYVIVGLGALSVLLLLIRAFTLFRRSMSGRALLEEAAQLTGRAQIAEANALARQQKNPMGRLLHAVLSNLDRSREELDDVLAEAMLKETPAIDRFGAAIPVMAAVAPLLGLLGTVTGMIATFDVITEYGTGNPKLLSGGISEALVTTEFGLIVAIPALLFGNVLASWAESIKDDLEKAALRITNLAKGVRVASSEAEPTRSKPVSTRAEAAAS